MGITCGGRMRRSSGRGARRMAPETKRDPVTPTIRAFGESDAGAATAILRASPEAAQWTEWGFKELLGWRGVVALVSEEERKASGFIIGRQAAAEAEILNLAVMPARRRKGEGVALLKAVLDEFRARPGSHVVLDVRESKEGGIAVYARDGVLKSGRRGR